MGGAGLTGLSGRELLQSMQATPEILGCLPPLAQLAPLLSGSSILCLLVFVFTNAVGFFCFVFFGAEDGPWDPAMLSVHSAMSH